MKYLTLILALIAAPFAGAQTVNCTFQNGVGLEEQEGALDFRFEYYECGGPAKITTQDGGEGQGLVFCTGEKTTSIIEVTPSGSMHVTFMITDGHSVHSRHTHVGWVERPDERLIPSQWYGMCLQAEGAE